MNDFEPLARRALAAWNIPSDADVTLIKQRENAVFSVTSGSDRFALRIHRAGYHTDAALRSELEWAAALNTAGVRTPRAVPTTSGDPFTNLGSDSVGEPVLVDLLEWFDGEPIGSVEQGLADDTDVAPLFGMIGELMATTHNHATGWTPPQGFVRHAWDEDGILGDQPVWGRCRDLEALDDEQRGRVDRAVEKARSELAEFGKSADRYGLIHADFVPDNLLRNDDGVCLIDFDDGGYGWFMFDIATTLFLHLGDDHFDEALGAFVEGYSKHRDLPDEHLAHLPLFFVLRGLTYLGWAHTRRETETAIVMTPFIVAGVDELITEYLGSQR